MSLEQGPLEGEWEPPKLPITQELVNEIKAGLSTNSLREAIQVAFDELQAESKPKGFSKFVQDIKNRLQRK